MIYIDAATLSLNGANKPVEVYIPLWFADGTVVPSTQTTAGTLLVSDGGTGSATAKQLHTLSNNWPATQKFALEVTLYTSGTATAYASFYDYTTSTVITASQVSTTSTTATVLRSAQVTLTPGHVIAVAFWTSNASFAAELVDASLIIFT